MAIDFSLSPELEAIRMQVRTFVTDVIKPEEHRIEGKDAEGNKVGEPLGGNDRIAALVGLRKQAFKAGIWLPHMPQEWGGMGLGHVELAMVQAEAAKSYYGPWVFNCQAPDEGNMHTLLHWGTDQQKEKYLKPLCAGTVRGSCFAMTEPEVAGSDPTLIQTKAYQDGDEWVINGHKWFISGARRAQFAILVCRTEENPDIPQAANSAFIIDLPHEGWNDVREVETMHGGTGHSEIVITPAGAQRSDAWWSRAGPPARPVPARPGPTRALHALDRSGRNSTRHDGRPVTQPVLARFAAR